MLCILSAGRSIEIQRPEQARAEKLQSPTDDETNHVLEHRRFIDYA
jgi:hypothetical protein